MLVPHQHTERKGSGVNPGALAKSVRNSREGGEVRLDNQRETKRNSFLFFSRTSFPKKPMVRAQHTKEGTF